MKLSVLPGWLDPSPDLAVLLSLPARATENPAQTPLQPLHHRVTWLPTCHTLPRSPCAPRAGTGTAKPTAPSGHPQSTSPPWAAHQLQPLFLQLPIPQTHPCCDLLPPCRHTEPSWAGRGAHRAQFHWDDGSSKPSARSRGPLSHGHCGRARLQGTEQLPEPKLLPSQAQDGLNSMEINELGVAGTLLSYPRAIRDPCEMGYRTP